MDAVKPAITLGTQQYDEFFATRIDPPIEKKIPWNAPIHKNNLKLLNPCPKAVGNKSEVITLKDERSKVMQLLLAANSGRQIYMHVFSHESSPNPPSLSCK